MKIVRKIVQQSLLNAKSAYLISKFTCLLYVKIPRLLLGNTSLKYLDLIAEQIIAFWDDNYKDISSTRTNFFLNKSF